MGLEQGHVRGWPGLSCLQQDGPEGGGGWGHLYPQAPGGCNLRDVEALVCGLGVEENRGLARHECLEPGLGYRLG